MWGQTSDEILEKLDDNRTRIEEHYGLNDTVYWTGHLHGTGKEVTDIEIYLTNTLGVLTPITAYKIGQPDWMWFSNKFRSIDWHPATVFPLKLIKNCIITFVWHMDTDLQAIQAY